MSADLGTLAVLIARLGPYHAARCKALATALGTGRLVVLEIAAGDQTYAWDPLMTEGFTRRTLLNGSYESIAGRVRANSVFRALEMASPNAVALNGWGFAEAAAAAAWCRLRGRAAIVLSDSQIQDFRRMWLKERVKRGFVRNCDSAFVAGAPHVRYLECLGMPTDRIVTGYDVVDNSYFADGAAQARARAPALRQELRLPERFFLTTARFVEKKNLKGLLTAFASYRALVPAPWDLVLVGDGPLRAQLEQLRTALGVERHVHFAGFQQYNELPTYYGLASAFILPSTTEQWGLCVNEAMASGLPVIVSSRCGCSEDLVRPEQTGLLFDASNLESLAAAMARITNDDPMRLAMGRAATVHIQSWGLQRFVDGMMRAWCTARDSAERRQSTRLARRLGLTDWKPRSWQ